MIIFSLTNRSYDVSWRKFVVARAKRILPLYWLFTMAIVAVWATHLALKSLVLTPELLIRSLLLLPLTKHVAGAPPSSHPILDQGWTLQYEAFFYIVCTLVIALLGSRRVFPWTPLAVITSSIAFAAVPGAPAYLSDPLMLEFAGGTLLGWLADTGLLFQVPYRRTLSWVAIVTGSIAIAATAFLSDPETYRVIVWGIPGFLVVLGAIWATPSKSNPILAAAIFLGAASYSIYLGHGFITILLSAALKSGYFSSAGNGFLIVATLTTIGATSLIYPLVEQRINRAIR